MPARFGGSASRFGSIVLLAAALVFTACRDDYSVTVDRTLVPSVKDVPGFVPGERRPLAVFADEAGRPVEFIEDELVLVGLTLEQRAALLTRTGATVVREVPALTHGLAELGDVVLIRVDPSKLEGADVEAALAGLAESQQRRAHGHSRVSSDTALKVLGVAAEEARAGATVALNVRGEGAAIPDFTQEALTPPAGFSRDAYSWPHLMTGGLMDYGVSGAWTLLHRAGKLGFRIKLAIIDGGFARGLETRPPQAFSVTTSGVDPLDTENPNPCTGGRACPWHGTAVMSTCCGLVDDGFGGAGTAGLVAEPVTIHTALETFSVVESMLVARSAGARIINTSFTLTLPWIVDWVALPIDVTTALLRGSGVLLFACAGNEGADVDSALACFADACWEDVYRAPCESPGVRCVGGMATPAAGATLPARHVKSNHGASDVKLYGPFTVLTGPDPATPATSRRR